LTTFTAAGVRVSRLEIEAPRGARVAVKCGGRGCPVKSQVRVAGASGAKAASIEFRSFERFLKAGVILEILVSKAGETGKYTRFTIRSGKLPSRSDACLDGAGVKPIACPAL